MRLIAIIFLCVCLKLSAQTIYAPVYNPPTPVGVTFDPTNVLNKAFWSWIDAPVSYPETNSVTAWVDRISGITWSAYTNTLPTNSSLGLRFTGNQSTGMTNPACYVGSNATIWIDFRPIAYSANAGLIGSSTNDMGIQIVASGINGQFTVNAMGTGALPLNTNIDFVTSGGLAYTNGVLTGLTMAVPKTNFNYNTLGHFSSIRLEAVNAYFRYIGIATTNLSASSVSNLWYWSKYNNATNLTKGLLAYWKMDEGSGTNIIDSSGNGYNGMAFTNSLSWSNSGCFTLNGTNSWIDIANNYFITNSLTNFTVSIWIKSNETTNTHKYIIGTGANVSFRPGWCIYGEGNTAAIRSLILHDSSNFAETSSAGNTLDNRWKHFLFVYTTSTNIYQWNENTVDRSVVQVAGTNWDFGSPTNNIRMGKNRHDGADVGVDGGWEPYNGSIREVRIYTNALSPLEIDIVYRNGYNILNP